MGAVHPLLAVFFCIVDPSSSHRAKDCLMPRLHTPRRFPAGRSLALLMVALACAAPQCGCVNFGFMMGKVFFGDPKMTSKFEQQTGVSLEESQKQVAVVCTAPASLSE